ncbi:MAG: hypothetical protein H0T69_16120, partial [Thermoleophilaceae bacterium]|nr:hypothetical protein [Thermoleophilaceae bacterium]
DARQQRPVAVREDHRREREPAERRPQRQHGALADPVDLPKVCCSAGPSAGSPPWAAAIAAVDAAPIASTAQR